MGIKQNRDRVFNDHVHRTSKRDLYPPDDGWMDEYNDYLDGLELDMTDDERDAVDKWLEEQETHDRGCCSAEDGKYLVYNQWYTSLPVIYRTFFEGISMPYETFYKRVYRSNMTDLSGLITGIVEDPSYWEVKNGT